MTKSKKKVLTHEEVLRQAFQFDETDLSANRDGYLTQSQRGKILQRELQLNATATWLFIFTCSVIALLYTLLVTVISLVNYNALPENISEIGILALIVLIISVVALYFLTGAFFRDVNQGMVVTIQGIAVIDTHPQSASLKHMEPYVFHCLPKSKVVVSVELMQQ